MPLCHPLRQCHPPCPWQHQSIPTVYISQHLFSTKCDTFHRWGRCFSVTCCINAMVSFHFAESKFAKPGLGLGFGSGWRYGHFIFWKLSEMIWVFGIFRFSNSGFSVIRDNLHKYILWPRLPPRQLRRPPCLQSLKSIINRCVHKNKNDNKSLSFAYAFIFADPIHDFKALAFRANWYMKLGWANNCGYSYIAADGYHLYSVPTVWAAHKKYLMPSHVQCILDFKAATHNDITESASRFALIWAAW